VACHPLAIDVAGHEVQLVVDDLLIAVEPNALDALADLLVHAVVYEDHRASRRGRTEQHPKVFGDPLEGVVSVDQCEVDMPSSI
jgi:hypothetical protein